MSLKITPTDNKKQEEGVWTQYMGVDVRIARSTKPSYVAEVARRMKVFKTGSRRNGVDATEVIDQACRAISNHILLEWKNFRIKGEEVEYNKENAYDLLKNDPDFKDFVIDGSRTSQPSRDGSPRRCSSRAIK